MFILISIYLFFLFLSDYADDGVCCSETFVIKSMLLFVLFLLRIIRVFPNLHRTIKLKYGQQTLQTLRVYEKEREKFVFSLLVRLR